MKPDFHRLLKRQIQRHLPESLRDDSSLQQFFESIDLAYRDFEKDYETIERTLEISSQELFKSNQQLNKSNEELEQKVIERTQEFELVNENLIKEIIARQSREHEMQRTDRLLRAVNRSIGILVTEPEFSIAIVKAFEYIGRESEVDEVFLFEHHEDKAGNAHFSHRYSWMSEEGFIQNKQHLQMVSYKAVKLDGFLEGLKRGEPLMGNRDDFPEDGRDWLIAEEIRSLILFPVFTGAKLWGHIGFTARKSEKKWQPIEENMLMSLSSTIGGLARQKEYEQHLLHTREALLEAQQYAVIGSFDIDFVEHTSRFTEQAAYLLGFAPEDLFFDESLIKKLRRNVSREDLQEIDNRWKDAMKARSDIRLDFKVKHPDGNEYYLNWFVKTHFSNEGTLIKVSGTLQDITERVRNQNQLMEYAQNLERINKELDQFAYIVSHDLKAPLRAINNLSTWIQEDIEASLNDETRKNFDMLRGRIQRMESLINGILEYSRAGRLKAETQLVEMNSFIQDIVATLGPPENFKIEIQDDIPRLNVEKLAIDQVFSNFISNAIKYNNNPEPVIRIGYSDLGFMHRFCIEDNGPGIAEEFHEKIFVIFQTLQARDVVESTGVGLAIVKKIVEEKGGKVWVESEKGNGARFYFTLPKN